MARQRTNKIGRNQINDSRKFLRTNGHDSCQKNPSPTSPAKWMKRDPYKDIIRTKSLKGFSFCRIKQMFQTKDQESEGHQISPQQHWEARR